MRFNECPDRRAPAVDERANDAVGAPGLDAGEPQRPAASQQAREHGLGAIVHGVSDRDAIEPLSRRKIEEGSIAGLASAGLERRSSAQV